MQTKIFEMSSNGKYRCIYCEQELQVKPELIGTKAKGSASHAAHCLFVCYHEILPHRGEDIQQDARFRAGAAMLHTVLLPA